MSLQVRRKPLANPPPRLKRRKYSSNSTVNLLPPQAVLLVATSHSEAVTGPNVVEVVEGVGVDPGVPLVVLPEVELGAVPEAKVPTWTRTTRRRSLRLAHRYSLRLVGLRSLLWTHHVLGMNEHLIWIMRFCCIWRTATTIAVRVRPGLRWH